MSPKGGGPGAAPPFGGSAPLPPFDPARPDGPARPMPPLAPEGRIRPGEAHEVPARGACAVRLPRGARLALTNTHGTQVGDLWAVVDWAQHEALSMEHGRAAWRRTRPRPGDALVTNRRRPLLTLLEDTSPGVHDTLIAACDVYRYAQLGHAGHHDNCADNLRLALAALGLAPGEVPCPLNLWMNTPADAAGEIRWLPPVSRPGDRVSLRAEMDAVVVVSACPMNLLPINGDAATIRPLGIERLD